MSKRQDYSLVEQRPRDINAIWHRVRRVVFLLDFGIQVSGHFLPALFSESRTEGQAGWPVMFPISVILPAIVGAKMTSTLWKIVSISRITRHRRRSS